MAGTLFIVSTPIGNLKDITLRAIDTLKNADLILCEDTRVSGRLFAEYGIRRELVVMNDFNEERVIARVIGDLSAGKTVALISDAGTPLISDPGFKLIREAARVDIQIEAVPGPIAAIAALTVSGLPTDKFLFLGFLPKGDGKRMQVLKNTKSAVSLVKSTVIVYESPFRILKTLSQIKEIYGDIDIVVCRELTKLHEEVYRGKISDFKMTLKGEFVILF